MTRTEIETAITPSTRTVPFLGRRVPEHVVDAYERGTTARQRMPFGRGYAAEFEYFETNGDTGGPAGAPDAICLVYYAPHRLVLSVRPLDRRNPRNRLVAAEVARIHDIPLDFRAIA